MSKPELSLAREFEASLAWWRAAGVDCDFSDDVTAWLADAPLEGAPAVGAEGAETQASAPSPEKQRGATQQRSAPPVAPAPQTPRRNLLGDSPPVDLAAFRQWWLDAPELGAAGLYPRIAPRGGQGAALMVLVPQPEERDRERLMEGQQGRLLANILAAMGLDDGAVYVAAALPCHTPMADIAAMGAGGMDEVLAHHIALAQPQRLLVLGTALGSMLTRIKDEPLRAINQTVVNTPVMVSETLDAMMDMPRLKARFWKRWIEWSAS
jgi:uracil-DNA glycosylase